ncbi:MAG: hypothetical protein WCV83_00510 [Candidatus Magasanikbacteria bacterium]|jgi:prolipoprotein diacylglyceryltransferase
MSLFFFFALMSIVANALTFKGKKFSWWGFAFVFVGGALAAVAFSESRELPILDHSWQVAASWAGLSGLIGPVVQVAWFSTNPPKCSECGRSCSTHEKVARI